MAGDPNNVWYVAELIEVIAVERALESKAYVHSVLLRAKSPEAAYERAQVWAEENIEGEERSADGCLIRHSFVGFRELTFCSDEIEEAGTVVTSELLPESQPTGAISALVKPKWALDAFVPLRQRFQQ